MKKAVIVFTDEWLPYSSTVLNLLTCLKDQGYRTRVVTVRTGLFQNFERFQNDVTSFQIPLLLRRMLGKLRLYRLAKAIPFALIHAREIREADLCFSVDSLSFLVSRLFHKQPYYVSLEAERTAWFRLARRLGICHVLIQTKERFDFLFNDFPNPPTWSILPNSPILDRFSPSPSQEHDLIYFGYVTASHGVELCIEAMQFLLPSYRLTLKGPGQKDYVDTLKEKYRSLVESGRLSFDETYVPTEELIPYLSRFAVGFCFYDFDIIASNDFNYLSCPSGKLYSYLAAGIPIIGSDILGLQVVRERNCGLLLKEPSPVAIDRAVRQIGVDREGYRQRCLETADHFDFRKHFNRFFERIS
jgi:glycosyltransferase involved in cell wall biosynthesis